MKITFDLALDGAGWPGPLDGAAFVYGETWVGPMQLLGLLETRLGLGGRFDGSLQRACRLARDLRAQSDSSSYDVGAPAARWLDRPRGGGRR